MAPPNPIPGIIIAIIGISLTSNFWRRTSVKFMTSRRVNQGEFIDDCAEFLDGACLVDSCDGVL
ncbi:hypothetical protein CCACVL1_26112 [Corchorus capsularis]|uniref:Uncharacterized protein n=1 Tax=Corchorus capsularis TaxID=210143 RepID=A0A1R3GFX2_COCAP|nr:hypothetical protein CCACVL1_26112 [Corchorus capsularis]